MVKDILLDIEASDVQLTDKQNDAFIYYETIWGKVFDADDDSTLFLNIVVPYSQQRILTFPDNGIFSCNILAQYFPEDRNFKIRFVLGNENEYFHFDEQSSFHEYVIAKSYLEDFYTLQPISACQLMNINDDGKYTIVIRKDEPNSAEIYTFGNNDLLFGESDNQSAKLLSLCGPGNNYRYPISGVGITDYINTVIGDSNLGQRMIDEFSGNNTPVISANFDNETGNLIVSQSSEQEEEIEFEELTEEDIKIIRSADDDFIRKMTLSIVNDEFTPSEFIDEIGKISDIFAIYIFGDYGKSMLCDEELNGYAITFDENINGKSGFVGVANKSFITLSAILNAGDLILINNRKSLRYTDDSGEVKVVLPFLLVPTETSFNGSKTEDISLFKKVSLNGMEENNDECAIITQKCKIVYSCYVSDYNNKSNGIYRITINDQSIRNILVVSHDHLTGRLITYISANSTISEVKLNQEKGQLIITKDNNE